MTDAIVALRDERDALVAQIKELRELLGDRADEEHWASGRIAKAPRRNDHDLSGGWRRCPHFRCVEVQRALGLEPV